MQTNQVGEDYEAEYWARQVRLDVWVATVLLLLAVARVLTAWPPAYRWWLIPIGLATIGQAAMFLVPWKRVLRNHRVRHRLIAWHLVALVLLFVFNLFDDAALSLYPGGAIVIVVAAAAIFPPRAVLQLGVLGMAGYLGLAYLVSPPDGPFVLSMSTVLAAVVALCVKTAQNRHWQDERRGAVERRIEALLENGSDAVIVMAHGDIKFASASTTRVLGYAPGWLTTERMSAITHPDYLVRMQEWATVLHGSPPGTSSKVESRCRQADGSWIDLEVTGTNRMHDPDFMALVLSIRDVTAQKALEDELTRQAFADSLTGLPNRVLFQDRVAQAVARNQRNGGRVTLLLVDLDNFKMVNDAFGHAAGDELIHTIAARMGEHTRPSDTLARLGGDEFAILVEDLDELEAAALAERLLAAIRRPVHLGDRDFSCTASIGIATAKASQDPLGLETGELLRDADVAMYAAKGAGRDRFTLFDPAMYADVLREADERSELERALANDEFLVHYQPIIDLETEQLIGVEALVRWEHPYRGLLGPSSFIPLTETTGLIVPLGRWVLQQALAQVAQWHRGTPEADRIRVSVNLSARQFQYAGLIEDVRAVLLETGIDPAKVVLEITESLLMQDTDATIETLLELRNLGVRLAIDDFGTGYSSLSYLKRFPIDILKIDKSFVDGIATDAEDATLAEAVVQLGKALGLQTIAEGIETQDQHSILRSLGCRFGQGYLFAKPVHPDQIEVLLNAPRAAPHEPNGIVHALS